MTKASPVHHRFAARAQAVRRRPKLVAWWVGTVAVLGVAIVLLAYLPIFTVATVSVEGAQGEVAEQAVSQAGIQQGTPLARVDSDGVTERVLEDPRVLSVDVDRQWPDSVVLRLELRAPAIVVDQDGADSLQFAAADGVLYDEVKDKPSGLAIVAAKRGDVSTESVRQALYISAAFGSDELGAALSDLEITADGDLRFSVGEVEVLWGPAESQELKAEVLVALFSQPQISADAPAPLAVDLSAPENPVVSGLENVADE